MRKLFWDVRNRRDEDQPRRPQNYHIESYQAKAQELAERFATEEGTQVLQELARTEGAAELALLTLANLPDQERARQSLHALATDEQEPVWVFSSSLRHDAGFGP